MKSRIVGSVILVVGVITLAVALWLAVQRETPDKTLLIVAAALICLGIVVLMGAYPERVEIGSFILVLRPPATLLDFPAPAAPIQPRRLPEETLRTRTEYTDARPIPGDNAAPFDIRTENAVFSLLPSSQPTTPMYLLDKDYRILDWNDAFMLAFDATMEGRRGLPVTEWVYFLENWRTVVEHGIRAFGDPNNLPRIDVEQISYNSESYGTFTAMKRVYPIPSDTGEIQSWLVILDITFPDDGARDRHNLDVIRKLRKNLMWSEYAASYDHVLNSTQIYPELLDTMVGEVGSMAAIAPATQVLDLGAGTGNLTLRLADPSKGRTVFALENNRIMFNMLRQKCRHVLRADHRGPGVIAVKQDINSLYGLPDEFFDAAVLNNVLYNLEEPKNCLEDVYRVLRPGGEVRISGPRKGTNLDKLFRQIRRDLNARRGLFEELRPHYIRVETINRVMLSPYLFRWEASDVCDILRSVGFPTAEVITERAYAGQSMIVRAVK